MALAPLAVDTCNHTVRGLLLRSSFGGVVSLQSISSIPHPFSPQTFSLSRTASCSCIRTISTTADCCSTTQKNRNTSSHRGFGSLTVSNTRSSQRYSFRCLHTRRLNGLQAGKSRRGMVLSHDTTVGRIRANAMYNRCDKKAHLSRAALARSNGVWYTAVHTTCPFSSCRIQTLPLQPIQKVENVARSHATTPEGKNSSPPHPSMRRRASNRGAPSRLCTVARPTCLL